MTWQRHCDLFYIIVIFFLFYLFFLCLYFVEGAFDLPEGSSCENDGAIGKCVNVKKCESFYYRDKRYTKLPKICSFQDRTPIVCCTDCEIWSEEEAMKDVLDRDEHKSERKYEQQCLAYQYLLPYSCKDYSPHGENITTIYDPTKKCYRKTAMERWRISGTYGEDAMRGDFPHMALLGYGDEVDNAQWLCGGSLISNRHILTAAHCGADIRMGPVKFVALGMLKRSDPSHYWKRYGVKVFYPHPDYRAPHKYHDIAIIETDIQVNLTEDVRPACLTHKQQFRYDEEAYATGWGALGPRRENADVMQKMVLTKFTAEECSRQYPPHRHLLRGYNHTTQMCYGDNELGRDTCEGDSGGPLQKRDPDAKYCVYAIIGVTSYGRACGYAGQAGMYTRVSYYVPWIESVIWPKGE